MNKSFIVIIFFIALSSFSQEINNDLIYKLSEVEKKPEFNGGIDNFYKFINSKIIVEYSSQYHGIIVIEFIVEKNGSLSSFIILSDFGFGSGEEAIRVLKLSPNWSPGEKNGKPVRTIYTFPITI